MVGPRADGRARNTGSASTAPVCGVGVLGKKPRGTNAENGRVTLRAARSTKQLFRKMSFRSYSQSGAAAAALTSVAAPRIACCIIPAVPPVLEPEDKKCLHTDHEALSFLQPAERRISCRKVTSGLAHHALRSLQGTRCRGF